MPHDVKEIVLKTFFPITNANCNVCIVSKLQVELAYGKENLINFY